MKWSSALTRWASAFSSQAHPTESTILGSGSNGIGRCTTSPAIEIPKFTSLRANHALVASASRRRSASVATARGAWTSTRAGAITAGSGSACSMHGNLATAGIGAKGNSRTGMGSQVGVDRTRGEMKPRPLGVSGLAVTPIGLGLAAVGRPAYLGLGRADDLGDDRSVEFMQDRTHELLDAAYEAGVRYVDTARSYGFAERFLSSWLAERKRPPGDPVAGSKWGYTYVADWSTAAGVHEVKDHSIGALRRQYAESRSELGDRLLLYQIHSATLDTGR